MTIIVQIAEIKCHRLSFRCQTIQRERSSVHLEVYLNTVAY